MFKMDIRQPRFTYSACRPLLKIKKKYKNLMTQEIHDKFIKTNEIKLPFNMTWLMEIFKNYSL